MRDIAMPEGVRVRWGWLRVMYLYTALGAGLLGVALLAAPGAVGRLTGLPVDEPFVIGIVASSYAAFGVLSVLGLTAPLRFLPVLLLQLTYKSIWLVAVFLPAALGGSVPGHAVLLSVIFATYVAGDLIAIPFGYVLERAGAMTKT
jgi:hypothetical protein